ncbi:MAG TPA: hypothetical protein VIF64_12575, partial [Pyrinomonadaceae bacterium]
MERCNASDKQFENQLILFPFTNRQEFRVTMIDNTSLPERLARELRFVVYELRKAWPAVKRDPIGFGKRAVVEAKLRLERALATPNSLAAIAIALAAVLSAAMILVLISREGRERSARTNNPSPDSAQIITLLRDPNVDPEDRGIG